MPRSTPRKAAVKAAGALEESDLSEVDDNWISQDEEDEEEEEGDNAEEEPAPTSKKKPRPSSSKTASAKPKVKGSLRGILDLPLETLALVCSNLDLATVFHLSRLNKRFWRFLRDRSVRYIWLDARKTSGLPEMSEPFDSIYDYANLLFGCCQGCGKATAMVDYILRIRCCKGCQEDFIIEERSCDSEWDRARDFVVASDYQGVRSRKVNMYSVLHLRLVTYILTSYLSGYDDPYESDEDLYSLQYAGWDTISDEFEYAVFMEDCKELDERQYQDGRALVKWQSQRGQEKKRDLEAVRKRRREEIKARFVELGWAPHHLDNPEFLNHAQVNVARDLTESAWKKMKRPLEALLESQQETRNSQLISTVQTQRHQRLEAAYMALRKRGPKVLSEKGLWPLSPWHTFTKLPSFASLWKIETVEEAQEPDPSLDDFEDKVAAELTSRRAKFGTDIVWRLGCQLGCVKKEADRKASWAAASSTSSSTTAKTASPPAVSPAKPVPPLDLSALVPVPSEGDTFSSSEIRTILARATSFLRCNQCYHFDLASRIPGHICSTWVEPDTLNAAKYALDAELIQSVLETIEAAGKPVDVSASEMDALEPGFCCDGSDCVERNVVGVRTGLSWRQMVKHTYEQRPRDSYNYGWERKNHKVVFEDVEAVKQRLYDHHLETTAKSGADKVGEWPYEDEE